VIRPEEPSYVGPRVELGEVLASPGVQAAVPREDIQKAIVSHMLGQWGDVCPEDAAANERALVEGERLLSVYHSSAGVKFYIITEADRLHTVVLLPEEY
jgi:hypothetical protein